MERLIDKLTLMILASAVTLTFANTGRFVAVLFAAIALISVVSWMNNNGRRWIIGGLIMDIVGALAALISGDFILIVPIVIYDVVRGYLDNKGKVQILSLVAGLAAIAALIVNFNPFILILSVVAVIRGYFTLRSEKAAADLIKAKDKSTISEDEHKRRSRQMMEERERELYLGTITERNRIAREIHDNVGHMLSRSILMVGAMLTVHKEEPVHTELMQLQDTLNSAMTSIRKSVHDLRDDSLDLKDSINDMVKPLLQKFDVNINIDDDESVPSDIKYAIVTICKECVSNIIKYSKNDSVSVMINIHPSMYQIEVRDYMASGVYDYNEDNKVSNGMGLSNIEKRAEDLGGRALITKSNGFRVFVTIPKRK